MYWPKWEFGQKWSKFNASSGDTLPQNPKLWWNPLTEISCRIVSMWQWTIFDIDWRQDALPEDHQQSRPDSTSRSRQSPRCTHTQHCSRTAVMEECCKVFNIDLWQMHHLLVHNSHSKWRRCPKLKWLQKSWTLSYCMLNLVSGLLLRTYNVQKRLKVLFSPPLLLPTFHCSKKNIDDVQFMFCFLWSIKLLFPATTSVQLIYHPFLFCFAINKMMILVLCAPLWQTVSGVPFVLWLA